MSGRNSHFSVGECRERNLTKGNCEGDLRRPEKWGKWDCEKRAFRPIFLPFLSRFGPISSTTSHHNPPQPTSRVLCPAFPHFPPFFSISPHFPPFSPIFFCVPPFASIYPIPHFSRLRNPSSVSWSVRWRLARMPGVVSPRTVATWSVGPIVHKPVIPQPWRCAPGVPHGDPPATPPPTHGSGPGPQGPRITRNRFQMAASSTAGSAKSEAGGVKIALRRAMEPVCY